MPDQTVKVTFTPPESWTFDKDDTQMTAAGMVILTQFPANQTWSFVSASVKQDNSNQFHPGAPAGQNLSIRDDFTSMGSWSYTVTVRAADGTTYTSPDPQITNKEPPVP